jgi:hypothetical protein
VGGVLGVGLRWPAGSGVGAVLGCADSMDNRKVPWTLVLFLSA